MDAQRQEKFLDFFMEDLAPMIDEDSAEGIIKYHPGRDIVLIFSPSALKNPKEHPVVGMRKKKANAIEEEKFVLYEYETRSIYVCYTKQEFMLRFKTCLEGPLAFLTNPTIH